MISDKESDYSGCSKWPPPSGTLDCGCGCHCLIAQPISSNQTSATLQWDVLWGDWCHECKCTTTPVQACSIRDSLPDSDQDSWEILHIPLKFTEKVLDIRLL